MSATPRSIVLSYFPGLSDDCISHVLWEHTGYPGFWDGEPEACLRRQLLDLQRITGPTGACDCTPPGTKEDSR